MIVQKCEVVKIEAIVRGYITGQCHSQNLFNDPE